MVWSSIIPAIWLLGWLASCWVYVRHVQRESAERGFRVTWLTLGSRLLLLTLFWPVIAVRWLVFRLRGDL